MIVLRITMSVIPEKRLEMMQTLISMIEPTAMKAGCLSYVVLNDLLDRNRFNLLGEWETREDLVHHIESSHFGVLLGTKVLLQEPAAVQIHFVAHSEGMDSIFRIRERNAPGNPAKNLDRGKEK